MSSACGGVQPLSGDTTVKGYLFKWTNYVRGYQRRWFVLVNGLLSYYRSEGEVNLTCRGTLNLVNCHITSEDSTGFVITAAQTWHLKASSEVEKQRWISALELARSRAMKSAAEANDSAAEEEHNEADMTVELRAFRCKFDDLVTCKELINKHHKSLLAEITALVNTVNQDNREEVQCKVKTITERATLLKISSNAMINSCAEFLRASEEQSRRWEKCLRREQLQNARLQATVLDLAKQQDEVERLIQRSAGGEIDSEAVVAVASSGDPGTSRGEDFKSGGGDQDSDDEFFDAESISPPTSQPQAVVIGESGSTGRHARTGSHGGDSDNKSIMEPDPDPPIDRSKATKKQRRTSIPPRPEMSLNLWKILKTCVGKDLSKIPLPVNFNEPLTFLQRLAEDLEYATLLDTAAKLSNPAEQMAYVGIFALSVFASSTYRTNKPFNPLLHETFELDLTEDPAGWRLISEQVKHHPPVSAQHVEGRGWRIQQEYSMNSGFRGKYLQIVPTGVQNIVFEDGNHYSFTKATTIVNNIIVGTLSIYNCGEMLVTNHTNGHTLAVKHHTGNILASQSTYKITGNIVAAADGATVLGKISGCYNSEMSYQDANSSKPRVVWTRNEDVCPEQHHFSQFSIILNEMDERVAPTDSRRRRDVRLLEEGRWQEANEEKFRLEESQRARRRNAMENSPPGAVYEEPPPVWFQNRYCNKTNRSYHVYIGGYWTAKKSGNYSKCPAILDT